MAPEPPKPTAKMAERKSLSASPFLRVFDEGRVSSMLLPRAGRVVIGRGSEADVVVDNESISRRHAILHMGEALRLEDLGSVNGSIVRGRRLDAHEVAEIGAGELFELGAVLAAVQPAAAVPDETAPAPGLPLVVDPAMKKVHEMVARIAPSDLAVLLLGETGVGKEVLADELHRRSPRAGAPLLKLNCAALAEPLLEGELFGFERGAFTSANRTKAGLIETANGGTVFLDEVGEMQPALQAKLLRVLEDGAVMRLGALSPRTIDVRFVCATNRDLAAEVAAGRFRQDLYFRLNGVSVRIPPLRERPTEIEPLARAFAGRAADFSAASLAALHAHAWPGNIRELKNTVGRAVVLAGGGRIEPDHLLLETGPLVAATAGADLHGDLAALEKRKILEAL
jgi:two-component system response regulator AtoC